jgi:hypothetical protein
MRASCQRRRTCVRCSYGLDPASQLDLDKKAVAEQFDTTFDPDGYRIEVIGRGA